MTQKKQYASTISNTTLINPHAFTVILSEESFSKMITLAKKEGRPKAQMARRLIEKGLENERS